MLGQLLSVRLEAPLQLSRLRKVALTCLLTLTVSIDPLASTSFYPALADVATYFNTSRDIANLCSSLDFAGVALSALYWSAAVRQYNHKILLLSSLVTVLIFTIIGGFATHIGLLIATRLLSSAAATGSFLAGVAVIRKIWDVEERGLAMGIFLAGPMASPSLGPVVGGALVQRWGWAALQHFQSCWTAVMLVFVLLFLPATSPAVEWSADESRSNSAATIVVSEKEKSATSVTEQELTSAKSRQFLRWLRVLVHPFAVVKLAKFPFILVLVWLAGFSYAVTGFTLVSIQSVFSSPPYSYDFIDVGLLYLPYALGALLASLAGGRWADAIMHRRLKQRQTRTDPECVADSSSVPEDRMRENAWLSFGLAPFCLTAFGCALSFRPFWVYPIIPSIFIGVSASLNLGIVSSVLIELSPSHAISVMALNTISRNLCGAIGGSIAQPLLSAIGARWLYVGLAVIALLNFILVLWNQTRGEKWRQAIQQRLGG